MNPNLPRQPALCSSLSTLLADLQNLQNNQNQSQNGLGSISMDDFLKNIYLSPPPPPTTSDAHLQFPAPWFPWKCQSGRCALVTIVISAVISLVGVSLAFVIHESANPHSYVVSSCAHLAVDNEPKCQVLYLAVLVPDNLVLPL
ncbi:uncharacterized protein LOC111287587 [Durio zibethinus]|uniref:Uncharacterized protein LOC111287587 n=1 Tax=Durio zibethinus TaxID=66656 RepID=A0A6P5Y1T3_DURZI|nr:uncharacterized protein LOC111287587 [Durio zibethinus]